jgi:hypothetical protein
MIQAMFERIGVRRKMNQSRQPRGCMMCSSLYVRANGEVPCWDDVGEEQILRIVDAQVLPKEGSQLFHSPELQSIRQSFMHGQDPFPGLCERCAVHGQGGPGHPVPAHHPGCSTHRGFILMPFVVSPMHSSEQTA